MDIIKISDHTWFASKFDLWSEEWRKVVIFEIWRGGKEPYFHERDMDAIDPYSIRKGFLNIAKILLRGRTKWMSY